MDGMAQSGRPPRSVLIDIGCVAVLAHAVLLVFEAVPSPGIAYAAVAPAAILLMLFGGEGATERISVPPLLLLVVAWIVLTLAWTEEPGISAPLTMRTLSPLVGLAICGGMLDRWVVADTLRWTFKAVLVISAVMILLGIGTAAGSDAGVEGWRGLFNSKNILGGFCVWAGATFLANRDTEQDYRGEYLSFNLNLNLPPPCTTGFLPAQQRRPPSLEDHPARAPGDLYCRTPQDSEFNVRGAKNLPCITVPGKRAETTSPDAGAPLAEADAADESARPVEDVAEVPSQEAEAPSPPSAAPA